MSRVTFDPQEESGLEVTRMIVLERLRTDPSWKQLNPYDDAGFEPYVEYIGSAHLAKTKLLTLVQDVFWELVTQGVLAPGLNLSNPNLPWFHLTEYGRKVLATGEFLPHDPTGYLQRFRTSVDSVDPTVEAYLSESLDCFARGSFIASVVMLGVASERSFLLLSDALLDVLADAKERSAFDAILKRNAMKPKQDWVLNKVQAIQSARRRPLPDNVNVMLTVIFDFIRTQRNSLGHPQETPPKVSREEAYVNLSQNFRFGTPTRTWCSLSSPEGNDFAS